MLYNIRLCASGDVPAVVQLCEKHAAHEQASYSSNDKVGKLTAAIFGSKPVLHCYVIESEQRIVGYFSFTFDFSTWDACRFLYLDCLYLDVEYRRLGIGREVFKILAGRGLEMQCVNIQWQTAVFNEQAIKFYSEVGGVAKEKMRFSLPLENHN
jgi:ribosomal protein S18 acetylase RimI-like enzyme